MCACKTKKMKKQIEIYKKGAEKIENDFDMFNYIQNMRDLRELKAWQERF